MGSRFGVGLGLGLAARLGALPLLLAALAGLAHVAARALQLDAHLGGEQ